MKISKQFRDAIENEPVDLATGDKALSSDGPQICPNCRATNDGGGTLLRTGCARRLDVSPDREPPLKPGVDYDVGEIEYV